MGSPRYRPGWIGNSPTPSGVVTTAPDLSRIGAAPAMSQSYDRSPGSGNATAPPPDHDDSITLPSSTWTRYGLMSGA